MSDLILDSTRVLHGIVIHLRNDFFQYLAQSRPIVVEKAPCAMPLFA